MLGAWESRQPRTQGEVAGEEMISRNQPKPRAHVCPCVRLHLQITNSKIMLFKFLRCQLQRTESWAEWLNVVVCVIALINTLMKLALQRDFLTRVFQ